MIKHKCLSGHKDHSNITDEELKRDFPSFCNDDIDKFILFLREGVYPYEYMDELEKFNETILPEKEEFYSKYGRYYKCRLHSCKKSLWRIGNKKFRWISRYIS